jgi:uncharacterized damage-inducible protein DinB
MSVSAPVSVSANVLRSHLAYTAWASQRLVHAASLLSETELTHDFKTSEHSVLGTLVHTFAADRVWLSRFKRVPRTGYSSEADYHLTVLQTEWPALHTRWSEWAAGLTDQEFLANLEYTDLKGNPWSQPLWQLVMHVVNHGTHHRGQVSGFLRALGHTPPPLDLVVYYRENPSL